MQTNSPKPNKTKCSPVFVKGNKSWCVFMAFSCKTGSIDRCLELDVMAPASERPSLVFWFGCHYGSRSFSPRTCLAFIFLSVIFPLSMSASVDVASAHTRLFKLGRGGGGGESGTEEFSLALHKPDPAGSFLLLLLFQGCMQARRENIRTSGSHLSATSNLD